MDTYDYLLIILFSGFIYFAWNSEKIEKRYHRYMDAKNKDKEEE
jgi:hypothetical protein